MKHREGFGLMKKHLQYLTAVAGACLLAACGGSDAPPAAPDEPAASATTAATAAADAPAPTADSTDTIDGTTLASLTGDAAHGEEIFAQCMTCHVIDAGVNRVGPSLAGIIGRAAGTVEGYSYTPANSGSGITWTPEKLFQYLENPARVVPGTKMAFAGLPAAQDRADVIAYLTANAAP
jgi:cytochrome c